MAIVLIQGWEAGYLPSVDASIGGNIAGNVIVGRDGVGRALGHDSIYECVWKEAFVSGTDQIYVHLGFYWTANQRQQWSSLYVYTDSGATNQISLSVDLTTRKLSLLRGGTVVQTSTLTLNAVGTWYSLEMSVLIHPSAGAVVVKFDGVEFINFTGNTKAGGTSNRPDAIAVVSAESNFQRCDDLVVADTTGSVNNMWLGMLAVAGLLPSGNGASSMLVGSDGNSVDNYQQVDEYPLSTADYNGSLNTGDRDTYDFPAVAKPGVVLAVQSVAYVIKSDVGAKTFRHVMRSGGGTVVTSAPRALATSWGLVPGPVWETDATGTAWATAAQVDSHEFGFEVG